MTYELSDTYLAGFLVASGFPLLSNRKEHGKTIFCFTQTDELAKLVNDYYNMTAKVNPLQYGSALKILKNIIYQRNDNDYDNSRMYNKHRRAN